MIFGESKPKQVNKLHSPAEQATKSTSPKGSAPNTPTGWPKGVNVKSGPHQK